MFLYVCFGWSYRFDWYLHLNMLMLVYGSRVTSNDYIEESFYIMGTVNEGQWIIAPGHGWHFARSVAESRCFRNRASGRSSLTCYLTSSWPSTSLFSAKRWVVWSSLMVVSCPLRLVSRRSAQVEVLTPMAPPQMVPIDPTQARATSSSGARHELRQSLAHW